MPHKRPGKPKPRPRWMLSLKYERTAATTALRKRLRAVAKAHGFVRAGRVNLTGYAKWVLQNAVRQWEGGNEIAVPMLLPWPTTQWGAPTNTHPELSTPEE